MLYRPVSIAKNSKFSSRIANRAGSADNAAKAGKRADSDYYFFLETLEYYILFKLDC